MQTNVHLLIFCSMRDVNQLTIQIYSTGRLIINPFPIIIKIIQFDAKKILFI